MIFRRRLLISAALACLLLPGTAAAEPVIVAAAVLPHFSTTAPEQTRSGQLTYRGGFVLTSAGKGFGGYSGLRIDPDGRFHAVSDRATWLTGRILYDGERPVGVAAAEILPVMGEAGPLLGTRDDDTEALEIHEDTAWIATEGSHSILRFSLQNGAATARGAHIPMPDEVRGLPNNAGLEALALVPEGGPAAGRLITVSEEAFGSGNHAAWLIDPAGLADAERLEVRARDGFAITDATFLPEGDLVLLERRYRPPMSLAMRLRRIAAEDIKAAAVLDGEVMMEASLPHEIDNMEAIAAHRAADGTTVLTIMSDDNMNLFQRTLLLQFGIDPTPAG
jgi:hypothetical protein